MYDEALVEVTVEAEAQLRDALVARAPALHGAVEDWLAEVFGGSTISDAFTRQDAFPMLLMPWWVDGSFGVEERNLHRLLTYSTLNGYLYIRLIDNLMDGDGPADTSLLPALGFFHLEFLGPYRRLFPSGHPFWEDLRSIWIDTAEVTFEDAGLDAVDLETFERVCARKTGAVRIPIAAVCYYRESPDARVRWDDLAVAMGRWHQMHNDIFGWRKDLANDASTYFLSEGRRRRPDAVEAWIVEDGFAWGMTELARIMREVKGIAADLDANEALWFLEERHESVAAQAEGIQRDVDAILGWRDAVSR